MTKDNGIDVSKVKWNGTTSWWGKAHGVVIVMALISSLISKDIENANNINYDISGNLPIVNYDNVLIWLL